MMKIKTVLKLAIFALVLLFFNSCLDDVETTPTAYGDVLVKTIQQNDTVLYGVYYYTYSYDKMDNVAVKRDGDNTVITLDSIAGRYTFFHVPELSEYKKVKPVRGKYIFDVNYNNGENQEVYDVLDSTCILPVTIKTFNFDKEGNKIVVEWKGNLLDDQYYLVLVNENNDVVFKSGTLNVMQNYLWIYPTTSGWEKNKKPQGGEKYKTIVTAYQYEAVATAFDLQSVSEAESGYIEWNIND
ncbi:MAG TPA: hypothetical protein PLB87_04725 [Prolixibacteraceae bacterium]|nr:hypothetical protein [Prolixibacteraceae bacterium]